jgi:hypothetical protein
VHLEFFEVAQRYQGGQRYAAARLAVQARTRPDLTPSIAGDEVLKVGGELCRARDCCVDVLVPEHLATDAHAAVVNRVAHRSVRLSATGVKMIE